MFFARVHARRLRAQNAWAAITVAAVVGPAPACGSDPPTEVPADAGRADRRDAMMEPEVGIQCAAGEGRCNGACAPIFDDDTHCGVGTCAAACTGGTHCQGGTCRASKIEHVVLIVQENHTFDNYFGKYCAAAAGTNPTCTKGRSCCEGAPKVGAVYTEARGHVAQVLDDASNFDHDRNHDQVCEMQQINGGAMDKFVEGATGAATCLGYGPNCADPSNWALADGEAPDSTAHYYWTLADNYALADRYFQPIVGGSSSNDMYFAEGRFRFVDNKALPERPIGSAP
jgi:phospholipase C